MKVGKGKLFSAAKEDGKFGIINILVEKEDEDDYDDADFNEPIVEIPEKTEEEAEEEVETEDEDAEE